MHGKMTFLKTHIACTACLERVRFKCYRQRGSRHQEGVPWCPGWALNQLSSATASRSIQVCKAQTERG